MVIKIRTENETHVLDNKTINYFYMRRESETGRRYMVITPTASFAISAPNDLAAMKMLKLKPRHLFKVKKHFVNKQAVAGARVYIRTNSRTNRQEAVDSTVDFKNGSSLYIGELTIQQSDKLLTVCGRCISGWTVSYAK